MTATGQDFKIRQGEHKVLRYTCVDDDNGGAPLDLSNATLRWRAGHGMAELTSDDGITVEANPDGGESNIAVVTITSDESADWQPGEHFTQLRVLDAQDRPSVLAEGVGTVARSL